VERIALAVLADMDGTLVDSTGVVEALWVRFAQRYGVDIEDVLAYSHGRRTEDTVARFLPTGHSTDRVLAQFQALELARTGGIAPIPGAPELFDALAGARLGVVTSAPRSLAAARLGAAGLAVPKVLVAAEDVTRGKPDPAGYLRAAHLLGVAPEDCLVLEDAEAGIRSALAAGSAVLQVGSRETAAGRGLPRVSDLTKVTVEVTPNRGQIRVHW
jgi:sugar-phosphatase